MRAGGSGNQAPRLIQYRCFRNTDPPGLTEIWNESVTNPGAFSLRSTTPLEMCVLSKPYFDPNGLVVAEEDGRLIGFAHAGLGPNSAETDISVEVGIICALAVRPVYRRKKIGTELLRRSELYLKRLGAKDLVAGGMRPLSPFYFGVYGGADAPGFLASDPTAAPFFEQHGYQRWNTALVFDLPLENYQPPADPRFLNLRRTHDVQLVPHPEITSWWQECVLGQYEPVEFRLMDKLTGIPAARTLVWEMSQARRPGFNAAGLLDVQVRPDLRRRGFARFLISQMARYLQENFFRSIEVHVPEVNQPAVNLIRGLGFEQVDVGRSFRKA